jgi:hypothetical protein
MSYVKVGKEDSGDIMSNYFVAPFRDLSAVGDI